MASLKLRLLILILVATPIPTLMLVSYEIWAQYQLPPRLLVTKLIEKVTGSDLSTVARVAENTNQKVIALPEKWDKWGANRNRTSHSTANSRNSSTVYKQVSVSNIDELQQEIKKAQPGTIITLQPGNYQLQATKLVITRAGIESAPIRLGAEQLGAVKLKVNSVEGFLVDAPYWIFENLDIEGVCSSHSKCEHAFHIIGKADHTIIRNNKIYNFNAPIKANGIGDYPTRNYPDQVLVEGNSFFNETSRDTHNPVTLIDVVGGDGWTVRDNLIADFSKGGGNQISYGAFFKGNSSNGTFENNLVICEMGLPRDQGIRIGLSLGGGGSAGRACQYSPCETEHRQGTIKNNIIMNCSKDVGIYLNRAADTLIANNTLINTLGIDIRYPTSSAEIVNNVVQGRILARDGGLYSERNNLVTRDPVWGQQHLYRWLNHPKKLSINSAVKSALLDKGVALSEVKTDFCGTKRRFGAPDIGAIEFSAGVSCITDQLTAQLNGGESPRDYQAKLKVATPNPVSGVIRKGIKVAISDISHATSGAKQKPAKLSLLNETGDGSGRLFVNNMDGQILILKDRKILDKPFLDLVLVRSPHFFSANTERGLNSFAFHPDFDRPGKPGFQKLYTAHTERPNSIKGNRDTPLFRSPNGTVHHYSVVTEWMLETDNPNAVNPFTRRELLRIEQPFRDHNVGTIAFNPTSAPDSDDYGLLYIAVGDGGNTVQPGQKEGTDIYRTAQDRSNIFGTILRIDPILAERKPGYRVPQSNPFVGRQNFAPEIWAYGLRNPQRFSWDPESGRMFIADIGQAQVEEINIGKAGANYGWSEREGTFVTNHEDQNELFKLPALDRLSEYSYPIAQYDHDEGIAVTGGYVYRGKAIPALQGKYIFGDIHNGRIFYIDTDHIREGQQTRIFELQLVYRGREMQLLEIMQSKRADLRFSVDADNEIYLLTKQDGMIRKLVGAPH